MSTSASVSAMGLCTVLEIVNPKDLVRMQRLWMSAFGKRTEYYVGSKSVIEPTCRGATPIGQGGCRQCF
jgi:hypothetical protein